MRVCSLPLKLRNKRMKIYLLLAIRLCKSQNENCMLQNRANEMNWVTQTKSKKIMLKLTVKHLIKLQILQKLVNHFTRKTRI